MEKNKKILIGIILSILVVGIIITCFIVFGNNSKKTEIVLISDLNVNVNSELQLLSLIKNIDNGEIISDDKKIDTTKIGEQELTIKYLDEKRKVKIYTFKINIVDTEKPVIEFKKELTTTVGTKIDLLKGVKVTDNSLEKITPKIEGKYDFNKEETYKLKYVAVDSSGNKAEEEFSLIVKGDKNQKYLGKYYVSGSVSNSSDSYIELLANGKYKQLVNMCEGIVPIEGTFTISGTTLKLNNKSVTQGWNVYKTASLKISNNKLILIGDDFFDCSSATVFVK